MTNLSRRGLFGVAGLLAVAPLASTVEAHEQFPPEGYTFCEGSEGQDWDTRFGADIPVRRGPGGQLYDVFFNGTLFLDAVSLKAGRDGWVAALVRTEPYDKDRAYPLIPCQCGTGPHVQIRIMYGDVRAEEVRL